MTKKEYYNSKRSAQILYDKTGMIYTNHPDIMEAMEEYASIKCKEQKVKCKLC